MARLPGARAIGLPAGFTAGVVMSGAGYLTGWAFRESTGGAPAALTIYDGNDTTGALVAPISLATGESTRDYPSMPGIELSQGLYVTVTAGAVDGSLWVLPGTFWDDYAVVLGHVPIDAYTS